MRSGRVNYPSESDVNKLGPFIRVLAAFILLCSAVGMAGLVFAVVTEPFDPFILVGIVVIGLLLHISSSIAFRGYAPKYLLFAHEPK